MAQQEGYSKQLALFTVSAVDTSIEKEDWLVYNPVGQLTRDSTLDFVIPKSSNYLDLKSTRLNLQLRIKKNDGTKIGQPDKVSFCNLPLHTIFRQVEVEMNQISVYNGNTYPYKTYIDTLLDDSKLHDKRLESQLFYKDTADQFDITDVANYGFVVRQDYTSGSKTVDLEGALNIGVLNMHRYLINGISVAIKLWPSSDAFCLMSDKEGYKVEIVKASLKVRALKMMPALLIAHADAIKKTRAMYPYIRSDIKNFALNKGLYNVNFEDIFQNKVPDKIVLGIVKGKSFSGQYNLNPFNFIHGNVNYLNLTVNASMIMGRPLTPDFKTQNFVECYNLLFQGKNTDTVDIDRSDYDGGYTLYVFDLTNQPKTGIMNLEIKFSKALTEVCTLIALAKFPALLQIDETRNVYLT